MKTIIVIYTDSLITNKQELGRKKKYSFNTSSDVEIGDLIKTNAYDTPIQVVKVLNESYKFYNSVTGEMSNDYKSTTQWEIRTLEIREEEQEVIYGTKISNV